MWQSRIQAQTRSNPFLLYMITLLNFAVPIHESSISFLRKRDVISWHSFSFSTLHTFHQFHDLYTELDLHLIMSGFHGAFATGVASQQGTLTLPDTWFRPPFWDLLMLQSLSPNSSNLPCLYSTFHLEYPLVLSRFYFTIRRIFHMSCFVITLLPLRYVLICASSPMPNRSLCFLSLSLYVFCVTCNDISVIYVTAQTCRRIEEEVLLRSGSQRHWHFAGFFNVPVLHRHVTKLFIRWLRHTAPFSRLIRI